MFRPQSRRMSGRHHRAFSLQVLRRKAPPSAPAGHLVFATSLWLTLRAASAANIGSPADISPLRRGREKPDVLQKNPSPATQGMEKPDVLRKNPSPLRSGRGKRDVLQKNPSPAMQGNGKPDVLRNNPSPLRSGRGKPGVPRKNPSLARSAGEGGGSRKGAFFVLTLESGML
jgi:hypothetical protein